ncbi:hypothetical protein MPTK1_4g12640 [Marchantia polymorpha subsp. ruderalis]|uniref:Protein FAR1-RELATED SEQUENCE n=2 Tax=Marchantia polymorpha TaxID=3197 RepID=A0AAF6B990_MARPO|nr:hypothetical protein MARPO_0138s0003 [Marchantia polymorpha]BBN08574.1 hypothetical protein Mp_4g12640 [Marchantia polymorpha subsp. ruderalis]|eukprot:PTQ29560.1 hypothetical protein MARPO_0138s0003 [Marchantia polymorpha]
MRADFKDVPAMLDYVNKTWIPHKTKFVSAWTYDCLHLRNTTTSCVEGAHAMLKRFLQVLTGDLHAVREEIGRVLAHQVGELKAAEAKEHIRVPHRLRITLFANLVGRIRHFALNLFYGRRQQLNGNAKLPECTGVFQKTLGLPCAQDLAKIPAGAGDLLTDVHLHWHLGSCTCTDRGASNRPDAFADKPAACAAKRKAGWGKEQNKVIHHCRPSNM